MKNRRKIAHAKTHQMPYDIDRSVIDYNAFNYRYDMMNNVPLSRKIHRPFLCDKKRNYKKSADEEN